MVVCKRTFDIVIRRGIALGLIAALSGCGDPVDSHIARLVDGGEGVEEAKMELNLAKKTATTPLIAAFQDKAHPPRARADLAQALYRLYLREADQEILAALAGGLDDESTEVRAGVARALGSLGKRWGISPLLARLGHEIEDAVCREILTAMELLANTGGMFGGVVRVDHLTPEQKTTFVIALTNMSQRILSETLRLKTLEWLEVFAEERAVAAHTLSLQADIARAEEELLAAKELVPDSKNINQKLGLLYYRNGEPDKGLGILDEFGMVAHTSRLPERPRIDGVLDESAWGSVSPRVEFYQCIEKMHAYPAEGRTEVYMGYWENSLYIGVKGYEPSTAHLAAQFTERDARRMSRDDCVEIFIDTDLDQKDYHHIILNSLGAFTDKHEANGLRAGRDLSWNGPIEVAATVADTFWMAEVEISAAAFTPDQIHPGDIWGFNIARARIATAEYGQWVPTYGNAHRPDRFGLLLFE